MSALTTLRCMKSLIQQLNPSLLGGHIALLSAKLELTCNA